MKLVMFVVVHSISVFAWLASICSGEDPKPRKFVVVTAPWCQPCLLQHHHNGKGDARAEFEYITEKEAHARDIEFTSLPTTTWFDEDGTQHMLRGYHTTDQIVAAAEKMDALKPKATKPAATLIVVQQPVQAAPVQRVQQQIYYQQPCRPVRRGLFGRRR